MGRFIRFPSGPRLAFLLLLASCAVAVLVWLRTRGLPWQSPTRLVDTGDYVSRFFAQRRRKPEIPPPRDVLAEGPRPLHVLRPPLDEEELALFFPGAQTKSMVVDSQSYLARKPGLDQRIPLAEHPKKHFQMRTNSFGMRRDGEPAAERPSVRVLVTGDSHTDGVVNNDESFCALLEARLAARSPGAEVLNAGAGGHTFVNYLGTLERLSKLAPHAFLVVVYGGNDFHAQAMLERYLRGFAAPNRDQAAIDRLLARGGPITGLLAQDLLQALYFAHNPQDEALAEASAFECLLAMRRRCGELGAKLLVAYLPPVSSAGPEPFAELLAEGLELAALDPAAWEVSDRLADLLLADLGRAGVAAVDLRPALRASSARCYWLADMHLSLDGHRVAAEALAPALDALLADSRDESAESED